MRFLRGALYNYFPIAGTETLVSEFLDAVVDTLQLFPHCGD